MEKQENINKMNHSYELGVVAGFSEMVNSGVKKLALSAPMRSDDMDAFIVEAEKVASEHKVSIYRESELIVTDLFPENIASEKDVLLLFQGTTLEEYLSLKEDKADLLDKGKYEGEERLNISRRFGRLLSYTPGKINNLLSQNTSFRTMADYGIRASNLFLYYSDLERAGDFYTNTLGLELVADYGMAKILRMASDSYLILVDAAEGMHSADEPKTVALAFLTDQLDEWYRYLKELNVPIKYDYKPKLGGAHDGFVAIDPEGYLLEFETFKQHPENENFIPILNMNETVIGPKNGGSLVPDGLGFHSTITWLYYKDILAMQNFYQEVLGLEMVADQGWAKIYKVSNTGFIGLVDERRGMHKFTEEKAVIVSFILDDLESWHAYTNESNPFELRSTELGIGPETRYKAFIGYDPEGYYMEFDKFYPHKDNDLLLNYLDPTE
jgi:catechol 2,3-dioxygenase-like lactoylglutathione lyase family enzyme